MRLTLATGFFAAVVSLIVMGASQAGEAVDSGLDVGAPAGAFNVDDITGPNKGKTLCYR